MIRVPKAYSYHRFSSDEQEKGNSIARQTKATNKILDKLGLELDTDFDLLDKGKSGYHGKHRTEGQLGAFLAAVEAGEVARGSALAVGDLDRLGREGPIDMLQNILTILWDHGITIVTPNESYGPEDKNNLGKIIPLFCSLSRAHEESQRKSDMKKASCKIAREIEAKEKRPTSRNCPNWLTVEGVTDSGPKMHMDLKYAVKPRAKKTLRLIFEWYVDKVSPREIVRRLNKRKDVWVPKRFEKQKSVRWRTSYVQKLLREQSLIGFKQQYTKGKDGKRHPIGEPIEDFFPRMIENNLWYAVQQRIETNPKSKGGRNGKNDNLFAGLIACAYCGGTMGVTNKTGKKAGPDKDWKYYRCNNGAANHGCKSYSIRHDEVESLVLQNCQQLDPCDILPDRRKTNEAANEAAFKVAGLQGEVNELERKTANLRDAIADANDGTARKELMALLEAKTAEKTKAGKLLREAKQKRKKLTQATVDLKEWRATFEGLEEALTSSPDIRLRAKEHIRELVAKIEIYTNGLAPDAEPTADTLPDSMTRALWKPIPTDKLPSAVALLAVGSLGQLTPKKPIPKATLKDFELWLAHRLKTKMGRFLRVTFVTGKVVDIVPRNGLAVGMRLAGECRNWAMAYPDLNVFWKKYKKDEAWAKRK